MTPATSLAEELGKAGQALKTLLSTSPPDDDSSELWHLRRIAMHSPASLTSAPPVLFHSSAEAMDSVLYGADEPQCDDAAFKEGLWCPPSSWKWRPAEPTNSGSLRSTSRSSRSRGKCSLA